MCDYSLYAIQNRLAEDGEELVLHEFETGTLGFASMFDLNRAKPQAWGREMGFWRGLMNSLLGRDACSTPAICVPPGARLLLTGVPRHVQQTLSIGPSEVVVFTEISSRSYSYRDALMLSNGTRVLLQDLPEGIHAIVLSTCPLEEERMEKVRVHAA